MEATDRFETLVAIMDRLRDPGGCPWDREQTYATLRGFLLEECYEVVEALDHGDLPGLREELGDLLFQVVFLSRLAKESGAFSAADVISGIAEKMIRRHPHVFGDDSAEDSREVLRKWEAIKRAEKGPAALPEADPSILDGIPRALPALLKAQRLGDKAARVGFDWRHADAVFAKVDEEIAELRAATLRGDREAVVEELGDTLFSLAMLARHLGVDPEHALEHGNRKFKTRFARVEAELRRRGIPIDDADLELLESIWQGAKGDEAEDPTKPRRP